MLQNSFYAISGTFYTLLNNTDLYLSYFILSYVFFFYFDSVEWGLTVEKSSIEAGKTAVWAEENKFTTYGNALRDDYHFVPIAVETFGSWGPIGHKFITDIGRTIAGITKNPKSTSFIFQAISMAVQRGNVQCVQGAYGELAFEELDEIFYIVKPNNIF